MPKLEGRYKTCIHCNTNKPIHDFYKMSDSKDGFRSNCKECHNKYYWDNRDEYLRKSKAWHHNNPDKHLAIHKRWLNRRGAQKNA